MTEYKFMRAGNLTPFSNRAVAPKAVRVIGIRIVVGARGKLVDIPLTDVQALGVISELAKCIRVQEADQ